MYKKIILVGITLLFMVGAGCISTTAPGTLGMFRSSDKGESWQAIAAFPTVQGVKSLSGVKVYRVFTDPEDHNALYMATRGNGFFYSFDRGTTWQAPNVFGQSFIYSIAVDPINKCAIYVTDGNSIYKTNDCMRTWTTVDSESINDQINALSIDYGNHQMVYASLQSGGLIVSNNAGMSWQKIHDFKVKIYDVKTDPLSPGRVYVASAASGLFRSDDGGATWENASVGLQNFSGGLNFYRLYLDSSQSGSVYWLSQYGIFHSADAGQSWSALQLVTSPGTINIYTFALNPKNPKEMYYTGTVYGSNNSVASSKLYKSTDGGVTWFNRKLPSSAIPVMLLTNPDDANALFVGFTSAS